VWSLKEAFVKGSFETGNLRNFLGGGIVEN